MMKYIDAEKLIAEIERLHKEHSGKYGCDEVGVTLEHLEDFIDSLQQKQLEMDLKKEIEEYFGDDWKDGTPIEVQDDMLQFARHFYELGLNARKEE